MHNYCYTYIPNTINRISHTFVCGFSQLGLRNSLFGLIIVYPATTIPVALYMLRGYFSTLSSEIDDAAIMDGIQCFLVVWNCLYVSKRAQNQPSLSFLIIKQKDGCIFSKVCFLWFERKFKIKMFQIFENVWTFQPSFTL